MQPSRKPVCSPVKPCTENLAWSLPGLLTRGDFEIINACYFKLLNLSQCVIQQQKANIICGDIPRSISLVLYCGYFYFFCKLTISASSRMLFLSLLQYFLHLILLVYSICFLPYRNLFLTAFSKYYQTFISQGHVSPSRFLFTFIFLF